MNRDHRWAEFVSGIFTAQQDEKTESRIGMFLSCKVYSKSHLNDTKRKFETHDFKTLNWYINYLSFRKLFRALGAPEVASQNLTWRILRRIGTRRVQTWWNRARNVASRSERGWTRSSTARRPGLRWRCTGLSTHGKRRDTTWRPGANSNDRCGRAARLENWKLGELFENVIRFNGLQNPDSVM